MHKCIEGFFCFFFFVFLFVYVVVLFCFLVTTINQFLIILGRYRLYTLVYLQDEPTVSIYMRIEPV